MTSPAEGIKAILAAESVVDGGSGWTGLVGGLSENAKCVALIDLPGRGGEVKVAIDYPSVQALVRGEAGAGGYSDAYAKAQEVYDTLQGIDTPNVTWTGLVSAVAISLPAWLGRDDSNRPRFSVTFRLITLPDNEGNRTY